MSDPAAAFDGWRRRRYIAAALAVALASTGGSGGVVQFAAPAGTLPAQHVRDAAFDAILPSGRIVTPAGTSVVTGTNALGFTLSPDGRFAIVSNDDGGAGRARSAIDPRIRAGYSLAVIDLVTARVVDRFAYPGESYLGGIAAVRDPRASGRTVVFAAGGPSNAVYVLDLDAAGHLTPDLRHVIPVAGPLDAGSADIEPSLPEALVATPDGRRVYVVERGADAVTAIDVAERSVSGPNRPVGLAPGGAALAGPRLLVTNEGLLRYGRAANPPLAPPFAVPAADPQRASSLSFVDLAPNGDVAPAPESGSPALALDTAPDGVRIVGGAHPTALAVTPGGAYAFVAMTNVDRIATVALSAQPQVVGGTELRLFDRGPYGTQPAALALSADGSRLYVALAGLNAVAVLDARDPLHLHRSGLLPTGWSPSALALAPDDRTLYVLNAKGFGHDGADAEPAADAEPDAVWSTLQKIDLSAVTLSETTVTALQNAREVRTEAPHYPRAVQDVVVIATGSSSFDAVLGDLGYGPADPRFTRFGEALTPNLHALARRFAVAGNFFADAAGSAAGHQFLTGGTAIPYAERSRFVSGDQSPMANQGEDPEDYPRSGSLFNSLARHGLEFRDYGDLVRLRGYDQGQADDPAVDDPGFAGSDDRLSRTSGLGGRYTSTGPAPAVLAGHIDPDYPGWNVRIRNERRAREFMRDYSDLLRARRQPRYTHIWLPAADGGDAPGQPPTADRIADGDRALGSIVAYLSRLRSWRHTAIFVVSDDPPDARDHVDAFRTYALVISPYAKHRYVGRRHLSTASILKATEQILNLPSLALGDLLATDMSDFFTSDADLRPFAAVLPSVDGSPRGSGSDRPEPAR